MHPAESWMLPSWSTLQEEEMGRSWEGGAGPVKARGDEVQMWGCLVLHF